MVGSPDRRERRRESGNRASSYFAVPASRAARYSFHAAAQVWVRSSRWIVVARGIELEDQVIGIEGRQARPLVALEISIGRVPGRERLLHLKRCAPRDQQQVECGTQPCARLGRILTALPFGVLA